MSTLTTMPATLASTAGWLRDLTTAKTRCEEDWGLPVSLDVAKHRLVVVVGAVVDAITMPDTLGEKVLGELRVMMLAGPVVASPDGTWWTFLTRPATAPRVDVPGSLRRLRIYCVPRGATAVIPTRADATEATTWTWVQPPRRDRWLPSWHMVIAATSRVTARSSALAGDCAGQTYSAG